MKPLNAAQTERCLRTAGYEFVRMRESHAIWRNPATGHSVAVPHHGSGPIAQGTLITIFNACGMPKPAR